MSSATVLSSGSEASCYRLANMAAEYCHLIDDFDGFQHNHAWLPQMSRLLSRLHVTVMDFNPTSAQGRRYCLPDDDQRCELYLHLRDMMDDHIAMTADYFAVDQMSELLADDFTDMYFDLKTGLELYERDPQQAVHTWLNSFYQHWGIHLLDAENWLQGLQVNRRYDREKMQGTWCKGN